MIWMFVANVMGPISAYPFSANSLCHLSLLSQTELFYRAEVEKKGYC